MDSAELAALRTEAEALFQRGAFVEALARYEHIRGLCPDDAGVLSDLGTVCFALGRRDESLEWLVQALTLDPTHRDARANLDLVCRALGKDPAAVLKERAERARAAGMAGRVEGHFAEGRYKEAYELALQWTTAEPQNAEAWNDAAVAAHQLGKHSEAVGLIQQAEALAPDSEAVRENVDEILGRARTIEDEASPTLPRTCPTRAATKPKVLFLETKGLGNFLRDLVAALGKTGDCEVQHVLVPPFPEDLPIAWADIIWLEWAENLAIEMTNRLSALREKKVICRLHRYEAFTDMPRQINWNVVDGLVFVAEHVQRYFQQRFPDVKVEQAVIHNGVDVERFTIASDRSGARDIAFMGHINNVKNLPLLVQIAGALKAKGSTQRICVAGDWQDGLLRHYLAYIVKEMGLEEQVRFEGWVSDVNGWLADKGYVLSTSLIESFGYAVCEGMCCGLKPVVHNFPGARETFPPGALFNTVAEAVQMLTSEPGDPRAHRRFVEENYPRAKQVRETLGLIHQVMGAPKRAVATAGKAEPAAQEAYDAESFWKTRLGKFGMSFRGVGDISLSEAANREMYEKARDVFLSLCADEGVDLRAARVLDIGCGTGFYAQSLRAKGCSRYVGVDITDALFPQLQQQLPGYEFRKLDICAQKLEGEYDLAVMIDVTEHITSDEKFSFAMRNIGSALSPNGVFIVTSSLKDEKISYYVVSRAMDAHMKEFPGWVCSTPRPFRDKFIFAIRRAAGCTVPAATAAAPAARAVAGAGDALRACQEGWMAYSPYSAEEITARANDLAERCRISSVKCEAVDRSKDWWEVDAVLDGGRDGLIASFAILDGAAGTLHTPPGVALPGALHDALRDAAMECRSRPNLSLGETMLGLVKDPALQADLKQNFERYYWEWMYPGTVFASVHGFLVHMKLYTFALPYVRVAANARVVDAACGMGYGTKFLARWAGSVDGLDLSPSALSLAAKFYGAPNVQWVEADVRRLPQPDASVDCLAAFEIVEHLEEPREFMAEAARALRPGGRLVFSTPNGESENRRRVHNPYHVREHGFRTVQDIVRSAFRQVEFYGMKPSGEIIPCDATSVQQVFDFIVVARK